MVGAEAEVQEAAAAEGAGAVEATEGAEAAEAAEVWVEGVEAAEVRGEGERVELPPGWRDEGVFWSAPLEWYARWLRLTMTLTLTLTTDPNPNPDPNSNQVRTLAARDAAPAQAAKGG